MSFESRYKKYYIDCVIKFGSFKDIYQNMCTIQYTFTSVDL